MRDPYNLQRFVQAQEGEYEGAISELRSGCKVGHWMWFIFPQIQGLGSSATNRLYSISSGDEARAYLKHPTLGTNLRECTRLVNMIEGRSALRIFGHPDDLKFRSSMTLFANIAADNKIFEDALQKYYGGEPDRRTLEKL